jgi:hypothetical protein
MNKNMRMINNKLLIISFEVIVIIKIPNNLKEK